MPTTFSRAFALAAAVLLPAGPLQAAGRVDVPIHQTVLPDGNPRYSVPVTLGDGAPVEAALDTGSFGLRILKAATAARRRPPARRGASGSRGGGPRKRERARG